MNNSDNILMAAPLLLAHEILEHLRRSSAPIPTQQAAVRIAIEALQVPLHRQPIASFGLSSGAPTQSQSTHDTYPPASTGNTSQSLDTERNS